MNENTNYVKSINGYPIKDEGARTEIANIETDIDDKISASADELKLEIAETYATLDGLATTDAKIDTTKDSILLQVSQTYETQTGTDTKIQSAIEQSASSILSTVSETYATDSELTSAVSTINQRADGIESTVATKVGQDEIISRINQSSEQISIDASKIDLTGKQIDLTTDNITIDSTNFSVDANGNLSANNGTLNNVTVTSGNIELNAITNPTSIISVTGNHSKTNMRDDGFSFIDTDRTSPNQVYFNLTPTYNTDNTLRTLSLQLQGYDNNNAKKSCDLYPDLLAISNVTAYVAMNSPVYNNTSLESKKKNFTKLENAIDIIKDIDIYNFNYKEEKDDTKKHIGLVIGENYKYSKTITNNDNDSVDLYSFISVCCKAIQEQQKEIEELKSMLNKE